MEQRDIDALGRSIRQAADANGTGPMTDTQAGLLPCPFCGNAPLLDHATLVRDTYHWVRCANEKCSVLPSGMQCLREADAITAWNRRPSPPASAEVDCAALFYELAKHFPSLRSRDYDTDIAAMKAFLKASGAAVQVPDGYRKFFHDVAAHCFDDCADLDYLTFTELGVKYGLLVKTMYDPEKHGSNEWGCKPGDEWFEIAAAPQKQGA